MKSLAIAVGTFLHTIIYAPLTAIGYTHPIHPVLVHLTIGTVVAAFLFDYIGWIFRKPGLFVTARHNLIFAFPAFLLTGCAGLADWAVRYQVASLNPSGNRLMFDFGMKFLLAGTLLVFFIAAYFVFRATAERQGWRHVVYAVLLVNVIALGFFGGSIIYG